MKIKVITSYKPGTFDTFTKRSIQSILDNWPNDIDIYIYHEAQTKDIFEHPRVKWIDLHKAQPEVVKFKRKHGAQLGSVHVPWKNVINNNNINNNNICTFLHNFYIDH